MCIWNNLFLLDTQYADDGTIWSSLISLCVFVTVPWILFDERFLIRTRSPGVEKIGNYECVKLATTKLDTMLIVLLFHSRKVNIKFT